MKVEVDYNSCAALGVCESLVPEVFEIGIDGQMTIIKPDIHVDDLAMIEEAVNACPTTALRLAR